MTTRLEAEGLEVLPVFAPPTRHRSRFASVGDIWRSRLVSAIIRSLAAAGGSQAFILLSGVAVARLLGVEGRGHWAALGSMETVVVVLGTLGVHGAATYYLSRSPEDRELIVAEALRYAALQAAVAMALLAVILYVWTAGKPSELRWAMLPVMVAVPFNFMHLYMIRILQGLQRFDAANLAQLQVPALYALGAVLFLVLDGSSLVGLSIIYAAVYAQAGLISAAMVFSHVRLTRARSSTYRKGLLSFGLRSHLGASQPADVLPLDQAAVAVFLPATSAGLYAAAYAFTRLPRLVARGVAVVAYPSIAARRDRRDAKQLMWLMFAGTTVILVVVVAVLWPLMDVLMRWLFGSDFEDAVPIARILLLGTAIVALRRVLGQSLQGLGRPGASTIAELSMYPVLIVLGPLFGHLEGVQGVAWAMAAAYAASLVTALILALRLPDRLPEAAGPERPPLNEAMAE